MTSDLIEKIYQNIERIRKRMGITQEELARRSNIKLNNYMKGKSRNSITIETLNGLSNGLDTKLTELIKTSDEQSPVDILNDVQNLINKLINEKKDEIAKK